MLPRVDSFGDDDVGKFGIVTFLQGWENILHGFQLYSMNVLQLSIANAVPLS
jgi:hypothetical protein